MNDLDETFRDGPSQLAFRSALSILDTTQPSAHQLPQVLSETESWPLSVRRMRCETPEELTATIESPWWPAIGELDVESMKRRLSAGEMVSLLDRSGAHSLKSLRLWLRTYADLEKLRHANILGQLEKLSVTCGLTDNEIEPASFRSLLENLPKSLQTLVLFLGSGDGWRAMLLEWLQSDTARQICELQLHCPQGEIAFWSRVPDSGPNLRIDSPTSADLAELCRNRGAASRVCALDLRNTVRAPGWLDCLARCQLPSLSLFNLSGKLEKGDLRLLAESGVFGHVEELDLSGNLQRIDAADWQALASRLTRIKTLNLADTLIDDSGLAHFGQSEIATLEDLCLVLNQLTSDAGVLLNQLAAKNPIRKLDVGSNNLKSKGLIALTESEDWTSLVSLGIAWIGADRDGMLALQSWAAVQNLSELSVGDSRVDDATFAELLDGEFNQLRSLDIHGGAKTIDCLSRGESKMLWALGIGQTDTFQRQEVAALRNFLNSARSQSLVELMLPDMSVYTDQTLTETPGVCRLDILSIDGTDPSRYDSWLRSPSLRAIAKARIHAELDFDQD